MKSDYRLEDLYREISDEKTLPVYVTPPVRFAYKQSDFLYLLYKELFKSDEFNIKSISVFQHYRPVLAAIRKKPSIIHYHWLECTGFLNLPVFFYRMLCLFLFKALGGKLVWTIHNKMPLDGKYRRLNYAARRWLASKSERIHILCRSAIPGVAFFYRVPEEKFRFIPHPKYPPELMPRASAVEAINHRFGSNIKMQDRLFLMIGHISAYKRIDQVIDIFRDQPIQKKLIIAGPVKRGQMKLFKKLKKKISSIENVILIPQFISEESVPEFMNACDYTIFNFKHVFSSGGVHLALSYRKPVIVPDTECMRELEQEGMMYFNNPEELKEVISLL
jgi:glycosyltransferase involved in cell wall biosynthesis